MKSRRRILAFFTALSIAWTALWPLVSQAHLLASGEDMPLCHQAGMQVSPDMAPMQQPGETGKKNTQHCPLCVMAFLASFQPPAAAPEAPHLADGRADAKYWAPLPAGVEVQLPQSRAPPASLPS